MTDGPLARLLTPCWTDLAAGRCDFPASPEPWPRIYGGQLLGQACAAAGATVGSAWNLHSLSGYFIRTGDPSCSVSVAIDRERSGAHFVTRVVTIHQNDRLLMRLTASYHDDEPGWSAGTSSPAAIAPDLLEASRSVVFADIGDLPRAVAPAEEVLLDLDYRLAATDRDASTREIWVRTTTALPDTRRMREAVIAYLSDFTLIGAALLNHRRAPAWHGIRGGSLSHALWLHRDADPAAWLLYAQQGLWSGGARGLALGTLYDRAGVQVATVMQEASIRPA